MPCRGAIAHGFQVLELGSELLNLHSGAWVPEAETGVRFDDTQLATAPSGPVTPCPASIIRAAIAL